MVIEINTNRIAIELEKEIKKFQESQEFRNFIKLLDAFNALMENPNPEPEKQKEDNMINWFCDYCDRGPCRIITKCDKVPVCPYDQLTETRFLKLETGDPEDIKAEEEEQEAEVPKTQKTKRRGRKSRGQLIFELQQEGKNDNEIANQLGIDVSMISSYINEYRKKIEA